MNVERRRAPLTAGELSFDDAGDGPPVVLLHGFPTSSDLWRREILLLSSRTRVIAPDLLGYGRSDRPPDADLSIGTQARCVGELLDRLGIDRAAVIGHDVGGGVAQLLALAGRADALVLMDSICFDAWPVQAIQLLQSSTPEQETAEFAEQIVRLGFDVGLEHEGRLDDELLEVFVAPWRADPASLFRAARALDGIGLSGTDAALAALGVPAFVIWGEEDAFVPVELAERLGEALPDSVVAVLPGCGHWVNLDAPTTVGPLIFEWLRVRYLGDQHAHAGSGPAPVFLERPPAGFDADDFAGEE
jgi:2-hydroxymuconate-semialdehyde hydrolase